MALKRELSNPLFYVNPYSLFTYEEALGLALISLAGYSLDELATVLEGDFSRLVKMHATFIATFYLKEGPLSFLAGVLDFGTFVRLAIQTDLDGDEDIQYMKCYNDKYCPEYSLLEALSPYGPLESYRELFSAPEGASKHMLRDLACDPKRVLKGGSHLLRQTPEQRISRAEQDEIGVCAEARAKEHPTPSHSSPSVRPGLRIGNVVGARRRPDLPVILHRVRHVAELWRHLRDLGNRVAKKSAGTPPQAGYSLLPSTP